MSYMAPLGLLWIIYALPHVGAPALVLLGTIARQQEERDFIEHCPAPLSRNECYQITKE